jgi:uncharacterized protein (DUF2062 family)
MLPVFGLHLLFAAGLAFLLRGSLPVAGATCLAFGNPLTHLLLVPTEYALGRWLLPPGLDLVPNTAPEWLVKALPAAEETLIGGLIFALVAGLLAGWLARRALRSAPTI